MINNRRDFLRKSSSFAAAVSMGGLSQVSAEPVAIKEKTLKAKQYVKDAGIKFAFLMGPTSPKVPYARQMGVLHAVSGVERLEGAKSWDPEAITNTKAIWDKIGIKWTVVEGPHH